MFFNALHTCLARFSLWRTLVGQDFAVRYRGTLLGRAWPLMMPLASLLLYGFVFGAVFRARWPGLGEGDHLGFAINLFIGLLVHGLLAESVGQSPTLLQRNSNFVKKMIFPLSVLVAVPLGAALVHMALATVLLVVVNAIWGTGFHWPVLAIPVVLAPYVVMLYGLSLFFAALGPYFRDLALVVTMLTMVVLFTGAVFFPRDMVPALLSGVVVWNPISWPTEALRQAILHGQMVDALSWCSYFLVAVAVFMVGRFTFSTLRGGFADVL